MVKKFILIVAILFMLSFNAFASDALSAEYLEEDNEIFYNAETEKEDDGIKLPKAHGRNKISVIAMLAGAGLGTGITYIFLRQRTAPPQANPYFRSPIEKHKITKQNDNS